MAKHTPSVIQLLRSTVQELQISTDYQWGHMGSCNCGFPGAENYESSEKPNTFICHATERRLERTTQ